VDRLAPTDRALLQAASVIGRRFDPQLLSVAVNETDVDDRLAAMQTLDLVHRESKSGDYAFKHALVRDALYQSLLGDARRALHLAIAEEIERRSGNRLTEVAEILALHYSQTDRTSKAFFYLTMAGTKSFNVYSLDEAENHFALALALLDKDPSCGREDQVADFLVPYTQLLNISGRGTVMVDVIGRYLPRIVRLDDDPRAVLIRHQYVIALIWATRFREAAALQPEILSMADRLGDNRSKAYALAGEIWLSTLVAPKTPNEIEVLKRETIKAITGATDAFIQNHARWIIGWEEMCRGRMNHARDVAGELMQVGQLLNDPRSTGFGLWLLTWIAIASNSYAEALQHCEQSLVAAATPQDRTVALGAKGTALILLHQVEEGAKLLREASQQAAADGFLYNSTGSDAILGLSKILQGNFKEGIHSVEQAIAKRDEEGNRGYADFARSLLCEVYLQIIAGNEKPPFQVLLRNLPILVKVMFTGPSRIQALVMRILGNPYFDAAGHYAGWAQMILGLLYKAKKKHALAVQHLTDAKRILSQFGQTPILARVETALAELGQ
jgi:tetratricopeptide (TPR) repeat protein